MQSLSIWINLIAGLAVMTCGQPLGVVNLAIALGLSVVYAVEGWINRDVRDHRPSHDVAKALRMQRETWRNN